MSEVNLKEPTKLKKAEYTQKGIDGYEIPRPNLESIGENDIYREKYETVFEITTNSFMEFYRKVHQLKRENPKALFVAMDNLFVHSELNLKGSFPRHNNSLILKNCLFKQSIAFSQMANIKSVSLSNCYFPDGLYFYRFDFNESSTLRDCYFADLKINLCKLDGSLHIVNSEVAKSKFKGITQNFPINFNGCTFRNPPGFNQLTIKPKVSFRYCVLNAFLDISGYEGSLGAFTFYQSTFNIDEKSEFFKKEAHLIRKSANSFKKHFRAQDNIIEANNYAKLELEAFRLDPLKNVSWWDQRILWWNYYSNQHGTSPGFALMFICFFSIITGVVFAIPLLKNGQIEFEISWSNLWQTMNYWGQILNLTDWRFEPYGEKNPKGYFILFAGRIFIGYGIYQFIAAFRKYGKN